MYLIIDNSIKQKPKIIKSQYENNEILSIEDNLEQCESVTKDEFLNEGIQFNSPYISIVDKKLISKKIKYRKVLNSKYDDKKLYQIFKTNLKGIVEIYAKEKNGLLLSGGADSRHLALLLKECDCDFIACIGQPIPGDIGNCQDVENAIQICELIGCEYKLVKIDMFKYSLQNIEKVITVMTNTYHTTMVFERIMQQMSEDKINAVWWWTECRQFTQ